ncbi:MAG: hypothetical protein OEW48_17255 [Phycisphaerae bacterium]|nr:hypothetical protein [Phycisphaerae bacterium]
MINFDDRLKMLAARARSEASPRVDVSGRVLAILETEQNSLVCMSERPLMWVAVLSSAIAASVMAIAVISYYFQSNPLAEISETISWVMQ